MGLQHAARCTADLLGRSSWFVRRLRPVYEWGLEWLSRHRGIPWTINGVTYRADPRYRHMLGHEYDRAVADFLRERVRSGNTCFDVGANVGVYVLQFARWSAPGGRVVAFEPNPASQRILRKHIAINQLEGRVEVIGSAVGGAQGSAKFFFTGVDGMSRLGAANRLIADKTTEMMVSVTTLDAYTARTTVDPDWLLIDIEGFEIQALLGARDLIRRRRGKIGIVVEMHPSVWESAQTTRQLAVEVLNEMRLRPVPLTGQPDPLSDYGLVYLQPR